MVGWPVCRSGWQQGPTHGYMCQSPVRAAAYTRPPRLASAAPRTFFYAYSCASHGSLLLFLSNGETSRRHFFSLVQQATVAAAATAADTTPRYRIVSPRGTYGVWTESVRDRGKKGERKKKERTAKRLEAGRRSRDSRAIELKGARAKERERKREKGRIGWGGAFQSRSEAPRVPTTIEKGETCRRGYRRGQ